MADGNICTVKWSEQHVLLHTIKYNAHMREGNQLNSTDWPALITPRQRDNSMSRARARWNLRLASTCLWNHVTTVTPDRDREGKPFSRLAAGCNPVVLFTHCVFLKADVKHLCQKYHRIMSKRWEFNHKYNLSSTLPITLISAGQS